MGAAVASGVRPRRDSTLERVGTAPVGGATEAAGMTPRKRVSLFVRRKQRGSLRSLRRAQSAVLPHEFGSVEVFCEEGEAEEDDDDDDGEDVDDSEEVEQGAENAGSSDDIVAEICLEDFAEDEGYEESFWDGESVNMDFDVASRRGSRVFIDEEDLKRLFEGDWFDGDDVLGNGWEQGVFDVADTMLEQWRMDVSDHNEVCTLWGAEKEQSAVDIRVLAGEFEEMKLGSAGGSGRCVR